jgi:UDP:flavonoid glycosyltransferase YjiC (YdhE family)
LSHSLRETITEALTELPYNVLWKWDVDHLPELSGNVMARKWLPQQDVLSHKNIKAFVTQGGLQSIEEAVIHGVPVVGMPFFLDQPMNVMHLVQKGVAQSIDHAIMTKNELKEVIMEVASNETYLT